MASGVRGAAAFRRKLRAIDPAIRAEIVDVLDLVGRRTLAEMRADVPVRSGKLQRALRYKVYAKSLKLRVGVIGKRKNADLFYGRILEFGRGLKKQVDSLGRRIGVIEPGRYVYGRRRELRREAGLRLKGIWRRALARTGDGG